VGALLATGAVAGALALGPWAASSAQLLLTTLPRAAMQPPAGQDACEVHGQPLGRAGLLHILWGVVDLVYWSPHCKQTRQGTIQRHGSAKRAVEMVGTIKEQQDAVQHDCEHIRLMCAPTDGAMASTVLPSMPCIRGC
jgi:hypothetical protein